MYRAPASPPPRDYPAITKAAETSRRLRIRTPSPTSPPPPPPHDRRHPRRGDDGDFDFDDDDDDLGFGDEGVGEKTLVDNLFIPDDVLADVQAGLDWAEPSDESKGGAEDRKVREDLRELDFYIKNGLKDEAKALLDELAVKHGEHPELMQRREAVEQI